jgi:hypothetical protein
MARNAHLLSDPLFVAGSILCSAGLVLLIVLFSNFRLLLNASFLIWLGPALFLTGSGLIHVCVTFLLRIQRGYYSTVRQLRLIVYEGVAGVLWFLFFASSSDVGWAVLGAETVLLAIALAKYSEQRVTLQRYLSQGKITIPILAAVFLTIVALGVTQTVFSQWDILRGLAGAVLALLLVAIAIMRRT